MYFYIKKTKTVAAVIQNSNYTANFKDFVPIKNGASTQRYYQEMQLENMNMHLKVQFTV